MGTRNCAAPALSTGGSRPSLIDSRFDHESCGVGFVATLDNQPSHDILTKALTALARLAHRGAVAADGKSSDGIGIHTAIPRDLLLASTGSRSIARSRSPSAWFFCPATPQAAAEAVACARAGDHGAGIYASSAGARCPLSRRYWEKLRCSTLPVIRQVFADRPGGRREPANIPGLRSPPLSRSQAIRAQRRAGLRLLALYLIHHL